MDAAVEPCCHPGPEPLSSFEFGRQKPKMLQGPSGGSPLHGLAGAGGICDGVQSIGTPTSPGLTGDELTGRLTGIGSHRGSAAPHSYVESTAAAPLLSQSVTDARRILLHLT